jgi:hypothetical protein
MLKKQCGRCNNFMLEEQIALPSESLENKFISAYHCIYCGRIEYGCESITAQVIEVPIRSRWVKWLNY